MVEFVFKIITFINFLIKYRTIIGNEGLNLNKDIPNIWN